MPRNHLGFIPIFNLHHKISVMLRTLKSFFAALLLLLTLTQCKKDTDNNQLPSDISPLAKEYIYFETEGLAGLSKFTFQDVDGYGFTGYHDRCPLSPTYVLMEVQKPVDPYNNPQFSFFFGTASQPSKFSDGIKVQTYAVNSLDADNAAVGFCHSTVNAGGLCASTMNTTPGNKFEIERIETEGSKQYAVGNFEIYAHTPSPGNTVYFWMRKGQFRIEL
jgi:hypothetical protein